MKLRLFAVMAALLLSAGAASAQVGLYINPMFDRISNSQADTGTFAYLGSGNKSAWFKGVTFGGYATLAGNKKVEAGLDIRGEVVRNNNAPLGSFLLGPRVSYMLERNQTRAYGELLVGVGKSHPPTNPYSVSRIQFRAVAGLDHPLAKHVDWRVVEVGYGQVSTVNTGVITGGLVNDLPANKVLSLSTGLVFRFR